MMQSAVVIARWRNPLSWACDEEEEEKEEEENTLQCDIWHAINDIIFFI